MPKRPIIRLTEHGDARRLRLALIKMGWFYYRYTGDGSVYAISPNQVRSFETWDTHDAAWTVQSRDINGMYIRVNSINHFLAYVRRHES